MKKEKTSIFNSPLLSSKVKSAKPSLFPEGVLGYFAGPTLALIANSFLASYFNKYLTDIFGIVSWAALFNTLLPIISVVFVVLGNIVVGKLMDRNKMKAGKARPLILLSLPVSLIALATLFFFTPYANGTSDQTTQIVALILIAVGYNLWFAIAYPLYFTPHSSLVNLSTRSGKDRSLLATLSNACNMAAMGLCTMIIPFFLGILFKTDADNKIDVGASLAAWKVFAIILLIITAVGVVIEYYFTRERVTEEAFSLLGERGEEQPQKTITTKEQWKICSKDKFWIIVIAFVFLFQLGGMVKNVSQLYYCCAWFPDEAGVYSNASGGAFSGTLAIVGAIPTALGMFIAYPLSNKIGKAKAILFGALISTLGGAIGLFVPFVPVDARFALTVVSFVIKALGSTPSMYLSIALLGDVIDHQEALYGKRTDGLSMTLYGAVMAGMTGLATGILNLALSLAGYDESKPQGVQNAMLWIFVGVETICYLLIFLLLIFMKVEKYSKLDHEAIVNDQKAKCAHLGIEYVNPEDRMKAEEAEADQKAEEDRKNQLRAKCEKAGLDFEAEEAKYQEGVRAQQEKADAKKRAQEEKAQAKKEAAAQKEAALTDEQKAARAKKQQAREAQEEKIRQEYEALREATKEVREQNIKG